MTDGIRYAVYCEICARKGKTTFVRYCESPTSRGLCSQHREHIRKCAEMHQEMLRGLVDIGESFK